MPQQIGPEWVTKIPAEESGRTCNGRLMAQEVLGHAEFVLTKLYGTA